MLTICEPQEWMSSMLRPVLWVPEWPDSDLGMASSTKSMTDAPVIAVGSVGLDTDVMDNFFGKEAKSTGEEGLRELLRRFNNREFDLISVGRSLIGDPEWVNKVRDGRFSELRMFRFADQSGVRPSGLGFGDETFHFQITDHAFLRGRVSPERLPLLDETARLLHSRRQGEIAKDITELIGKTPLVI